jgi:hypothetical protein
VTRLLLVRVESLRTGWSFLGVCVPVKPRVLAAEREFGCDSLAGTPGTDSGRSPLRCWTLRTGNRGAQ